MNQKNTTYLQLIKAVPKSLQLFLNVCLVLLALILCFLLFKELIEFLKILLFAKEDGDYKLFLANILIFFLYFEFITMIIKYFKEDYHFPLRYFIYIGITAMIRLIIVEHDHPLNTQEENVHFFLEDVRNGTNHLIPSVYHASAVSGVGLMYRIINVKGFFDELITRNFNGVTLTFKLNVMDSLF